MMKPCFCNARAVIKSSSAWLEGKRLSWQSPGKTAMLVMVCRENRITFRLQKVDRFKRLGRKQYSGSTKWLNGPHDMVGVSFQRRAVTRSGLGDEAGTINPDPQLSPFAVVFLIYRVVGD